MLCVYWPHASARDTGRTRNSGRRRDARDLSARAASRAVTTSLDAVAQAKLAALERRELRRRLVTTERRGGTRAVHDGAELVSFASNDYLGLAQHPDVVAASTAATQRYGASASGSRLVVGNHPPYAELERKLAALLGSEDAVVFGSGYLANLGVIAALAGPTDLLLIDALGHSCHSSGAHLAGGRVLEFRHNDVAHAADLLERHRQEHRRCLILTEGVFSMDGDLPPLPALAALADRYDAWLLVDDAHGLGVVGGGRGAAFVDDPPVRVPLLTGALSKAAGSYGGYVCTSHAVAELLRNRARSFVFSTGLPPGAIAAASRALDFIAVDGELVLQPLARARLFTAELGLPPAASAIVSLVLGSPQRALHTSERLRDAGFLVAAIRPPTVPHGTSRLRVTFSAEHTEQQVLDLAAAVAPLLNEP
jgi:8-amino-7-oxononanoate synthase